jgi:hypothetical protein
MSFSQTPAAARSDVLRVPADQPVEPRPFRRRGMLLSAGAVLWGLDCLVLGADPEGGLEEALSSVTSGTFQLGLLGLLSVLEATRALGEGRLARFFLRLEAVLVVLAIGSTVADGTGASDLDKVGWALLDACWPLSMMGMFLIGIRIAVAGRWRGRARFWPLVAESWAPVVIPVFGIFGSTVAGVVAGLHLFVGYGVLGQIVARKQS